MANVVILKQPLYGSVVWNGVEFEYTPNPDFLGNDTYTYRITDIKGSRVVTNYVNPTNLPPTAKNITVNALANDLTEVDISQIVDDATDPFKYLFITNVESDVVMGSVRTDGKKIYFAAGFFNTTEYVNYTVTDKQFESSGRISFNITGGINPEDYKGSPYFRFGVLLNKINGIRPISANWSTMYDLMTTYGPTWDSVDADRYNSMADVVSGSDADANYKKWNNSYLNVTKFETLYNTVCGNSARWEDYRTLGNNTYDLVDSQTTKYDFERDVLLANRNTWSNSIYKTNDLITRVYNISKNLTAVSDAVSNYSYKWDRTELDELSSNYFKFWEDLYNRLITNQNDIKWNDVYSNFVLLSTEISNTTIKIDNTKNTYNSNSGYWKISEINGLSSRNFDIWNNLYNTLNVLKLNWDNNVNDFEKLSTTYYTDTPKYTGAYNTLTASYPNLWNIDLINSVSATNFDNWNSLSNTINSYKNNWNNNVKNLTSFDYVYNTDTPNYVGTYNTVLDKAITWGHTSVDVYSAANFNKWNSGYNKLNLYKNNWDNNSTNIDTFSSTYYNGNTDYTGTYNTLTAYSSDLWNINLVNSISADLFNKWNQVYNLITLSSFEWFDQEHLYFVGDYDAQSYNFTKTYNTVLGNSSNWGHTTLDAYSGSNFGKWDGMYNTISGNIDKWGNIDYNSLISFSANYYNDASNYNGLYNTYRTASSKWGHTTFDTYSANNFPKWDAAYNVSFNLDDTKTAFGSFSGEYLSAADYLHQFYSTVDTSYSGAWDLSFVPKISAYIQVWDDFYDILLATSTYIDLWTNTYNRTLSLSTSYLSAKNRFNGTTNTVQSYSGFWGDTSASTVLTSYSDNWNSGYNTINELSSGWFFKENIPLSSIVSVITSQSAKWNNETNIITNNTNSWNNYLSVSSLSSNALTGSGTITLSTNDISVYGNTTIKGNLSALGKKIKINTSLYTISGFEITNDGASNALTVSKNGGFDKAIVNFDTLSSIILYVKTSNSVGINTSAFPATMALTVSGNISATGVVYPLNSTVTKYQSQSGYYTSTYNNITSVSSNFSLVSASSASYKIFSDYIELSSNNITKLKNNKTSFDVMSSFVTTNSGYNANVNNFITNSGSYFGVDTYYTDNKEKYDTLYNSVTTLSTGVWYDDIVVQFSYNKKTRSNKAFYVVQDNIKIESWTIVANISTIAQVDILSSTANNWPNVLTVTRNINVPHLDLTNSEGKNYNNNLSQWRQYIAKDSILQFTMTNNNAASSLMVSLKVSKQ